MSSRARTSPAAERASRCRCIRARPRGVRRRGSRSRRRPGGRCAGAADATPTADAPWPLASERPERWLAWPRYDRPDDLEQLLATWAEALVDHPDRCLCLRHDPAHDGDLLAAIERLESVYARLIPDGRAIEVLMVDGPIPERDLPRLGRAVQGVLRVPGRDDPLREAWARRLGAPELHDPATLVTA